MTYKRLCLPAPNDYNRPVWLLWLWRDWNCQRMPLLSFGHSILLM